MLDHVTDTVVPTVQAPPPFGLMTVIVGLAIVKFTSLVSLTAPFTVHVARMRAVVVDGPVTVQLKLPLVDVEFATDALSTESNDPVMETITLVCERIERVK